MAGRGLLHRHEGEYLQQMILHDVPDDAELVKVAATALRAEGLLERDLHHGDVLAVPRGTEDPVTEAQGHQVLHHFLAEIVIDAIELFLLEQCGQVVGEHLRGGGITAERLLDDYPRPASVRRFWRIEIN